MVMTQPLYRDSVVLFMLEAIRLYPKQEGLLVSLQLQHRQLTRMVQVEAMAALQNVVSPENPSEILDNCAMIREFGGIGIVSSATSAAASIVLLLPSALLRQLSVWL